MEQDPRMVSPPSRGCHWRKNRWLEQQQPWLQHGIFTGNNSYMDYTLDNSIYTMDMKCDFPNNGWPNNPWIWLRHFTFLIGSRGNQTWECFTSRIYRWENPSCKDPFSSGIFQPRFDFHYTIDIPIISQLWLSYSIQNYPTILVVISLLYPVLIIPLSNYCISPAKYHCCWLNQSSHYHIHKTHINIYKWWLKIPIIPTIQLIFPKNSPSNIAIIP